LQLRPTASTVEVFQLVGEEARRRGDDRVRGGHILIGLARSPGTAAAVAMEGSGVDREVLSRRLDARLPGNQGVGGGTVGELPYDPGAARIIQGIMERTMDAGRETLSTADVLHGILAHGEPWLRDALTEAGGDVDTLPGHLDQAPPEG